MNFKKYQRKGLSEMVSAAEFILNGGDMTLVSISKPDEELAKEEPFIFEQGYVARNPKNHEDMWYVAKDYFDQNLEPATEVGHAPLGRFHRLRIGMGNFGEAIEAAKQGKRIARSGWNGKGMFVFMRPADELEVGFIIDKVESLPQSVKDFFAAKEKSKAEEVAKGAMASANPATVRFGAYICMYAADGSIVNGWLASQTDMLAEDWCVVD
jgi:hypothetical protein